MLRADRKLTRLTGLAVIAYWGIVLFGYDTSVIMLYLQIVTYISSHSGIAGGVVSQAYFQHHFGLIGANGKANAKLVADVSSNVVSVLQAGAFFGALGSAPISSRIGRRWTLVIFALVFALGAVSHYRLSSLKKS